MPANKPAHPNRLSTFDGGWSGARLVGACVMGPPSSSGRCTPESAGTGPAERSRGVRASADPARRGAAVGTHVRSTSRLPYGVGAGHAPRSMQSVDVSTRRWRRNARSAPRERTTRRNRLGSVAAGGPITLASPRSAEAPCICKLRSRGGHAADPRWAMDRLSPSAYKVVAPDAADRPRLGRQVHGPAITYRETSGAASGATSVPNRPDYNNPST
jgi:hypothetical protein